MPLPFVRILRLEGMKRGLAVDKSGKLWEGFFSGRTDEEIRLTGVLGSVGLCFCCGDRVHEGWQCCNVPRDLCDNCVLLPAQDRIFVVKEPIDEETWKRLKKEFRSANFNRQQLTSSRKSHRHSNASAARRP